MARKKIIKRGKLISLESLNFLLRPLHASLISLLVIRLFSDELWGSFVVFLIAVELFNSLLSWGQKPYLLREFSLQPFKINEFWVKAFIARLPIVLLVVVVVLVLPSLQDFYLPLILWVLFKFLSSLFEPYIQFHRKYTHSILSELAAMFASIMAIYLFKEKMNLHFLIWVFVCSGIVKLLALLPMLTGWIMPKLSFFDLRNELILSFPFFALSIAGLIQSKSDLYAVTYFLPKSEIASYQVIIGFLILGQTFSAIVLGPFQKNIYRWQGNDFKKLKRTYLGIGIVASATFCIALYIVLQYLYLIETPVVYLVCFFLYLIPLYAYLIESQMLLKNKMEVKLLKFTVYSGISNIGFSLLLVPFYGIVGGLLSGIVCRVILASLVVHHSKKIIA